MGTWRAPTYQVIQLRHSHALLPFSHDMVLDEGLGDVVNHERLIWEQLYELFGHSQVLRIDQDIVSEIVFL